MTTLILNYNHTAVKRIFYGLLLDYFILGI